MVLTCPAVSPLMQGIAGRSHDLDRHSQHMGRQAITRTSWLVDFIHTFDCQVLCLQEIDVNIFSGPRFVQELGRHGLHVFLGESDDHCYRAAIVSRVPGKSIQLGVLEQSRLFLNSTLVLDHIRSLSLPSATLPSPTSWMWPASSESSRFHGSCLET